MVQPYTSILACPDDVILNLQEISDFGTSLIIIAPVKAFLF